MAIGERDLMGGFAKGLKVLEAFGPDTMRSIEKQLLLAIAALRDMVGYARDDDTR